MSPARHRQGATMQSTQPALTGQETERNRVYMKIGFTELLVVVIVAFVFIGPNQLPEYARKLGKMLRELRKYTSTASKDIQENIVEPLNEIQQPLKEAISPLTDIKKDIDNSVKDVTKSFTGIGKTMSTLFPALKAMGEGCDGRIFYLTARTTARTAAESALARLRQSQPELRLKSITLTAKDKVCLLEKRECTPDACPYARSYYDRLRDALWQALDEDDFTRAKLEELAKRFTLCPFEFGLDVSLWCDVIVGDYNYLFDPVVNLKRFFEAGGDHLFLVDEAHNLPDRARDMHSAGLCKSEVFRCSKLLGKGRGKLKTALNRLNRAFIDLRHQCEGKPGRTFFSAPALKLRKSPAVFC